MAARSRTTTRRAPCKPQARVAAGHGPPVERRIVRVIGSNTQRVDHVCRSLDRLDVRVEPCKWTSLPAAICRATEAVVLVDPVRRNSALPLATKVIRELPDGANVSLFALARGKPQDSLVRKIYDAGATAVFEWPREALILPRLVAEVLGIEEVRGVASEPDVALARTVRAHLRLRPDAPDDIKVEARDGQVSLSGTVDSLRCERDVCAAVENVPGVRSVDSERLIVLPRPLPDAEIARNVRGLIRATANGECDGVRVTVDGGHAKLTGAATSQASLDRLVDLLVNVHGLRGIDVEKTAARSFVREVPALPC